MTKLYASSGKTSPIRLQSDLPSDYYSGASAIEKPKVPNTTMHTKQVSLRIMHSKVD